MVDPAGLEPATSSLQMRRSDQLNYGPSVKFPKSFAGLVGVEGIEPSTPFLSGTCSTTEPHAQC